MNNSGISAKEYRVIEAISGNPDISQRDISSTAGLSLGLTNILVNRLAKKGYLKAKKLSPRKISYIITPKGLKEKTGKSYAFMKRSLRALGSLRKIIEEHALARYEEGVRNFVILGSGELSDITELSIRALNLEGGNIIRKETRNGIRDAAVFNTTPESFNKEKTLDIWSLAGEIYGSDYEL